MRKTLHLLPLELAAAAHAATRHYRSRDAARLAYNAGVPAGGIADLTERLVPCWPTGRCRSGGSSRP